MFVISIKNYLRVVIFLLFRRKYYVNSLERGYLNNIHFTSWFEII